MLMSLPEFPLFSFCLADASAFGSLPKTLLSREGPPEGPSHSDTLSSALPQGFGLGLTCSVSAPRKGGYCVCHSHPWDSFSSRWIDAGEINEGDSADIIGPHAEGCGMSLLARAAPDWETPAGGILWVAALRGAGGDGRGSAAYSPQTLAGS